VCGKLKEEEEKITSVTREKRSIKRTGRGKKKKKKGRDILL
jgi:hypothetical protein